MLVMATEGKSKWRELMSSLSIISTKYDYKTCWQQSIRISVEMVLFLFYIDVSYIFFVSSYKTQSQQLTQKDWILLTPYVNEAHSSPFTMDNFIMPILPPHACNFIPQFETVSSKRSIRSNPLRPRRKFHANFILSTVRYDLSHGSYEDTVLEL